MADLGLRTLDDLKSIPQKRVVVRVDFNVPVDESGRITDDTRIKAAIPTLQELTRASARVIILSHRGRPSGWKGASLEGVALRLSSLMDRPVTFVDDIVGKTAHQAVQALKPGHLLLLQNLRYEAGEKAGDPAFAERLAALGELYVNDAFGTAHRGDASVALLPKILPGYAGRLLMRELLALKPLVDGPKRPYWAVIGGSKVSDKAELLGALLSRVDGIAVGGGMANTFLKAQGHHLGASKVERDVLDMARNILERAKEMGVRILLPETLVVAKSFDKAASPRTVSLKDLEADDIALDLAQESVDRMLAAMHSARTIFWNGPLGVFEWDNFAEGTMRMARGLAQLPGQVIVGGGDSVAAIEKAGVFSSMAHVSTGGGAALKMLEGQTLVGVQALMHSPKGWGNG